MCARVTTTYAENTCKGTYCETRKEGHKKEKALPRMGKKCATNRA